MAETICAIPEDVNRRAGEMAYCGRLESTLLGKLLSFVMVVASAVSLASCANSLPPPPPYGGQSSLYRIGPGDGLYIFVWENRDLSTAVTVRPDGRISFPLVNDVPAAGKTPTQLSRDIQRRLAKYVKDPVVTVMVNNFVGEYSEQIRIVGEATKPSAIPYRKGMTVLDAMIAVGGLTQYADGNRSTLVRAVGRDTKETYGLALDKLLKDGDISVNVPLEPGDIIIIPQTFF
jgi:polysaccharide export outer membrane protein